MKKAIAWIISKFTPSTKTVFVTESGNESSFEPVTDTHEPVTEIPPPTEQQIQDGIEYFKQEYLRHEEDALKAIDTIERLMGSGKAFLVSALQFRSAGKYNEEYIKKLQKIGVVGHPDPNDKSRWVVVRDRDKRLKFFESQIARIVELAGEYRFHEQALLEYEDGKRAPLRTPTPPTVLKKVD